MNGATPAFSVNVVLLCYIGGVVYQINAFQQRYHYNAGSNQWLAVNSGDPRIGNGLVAYGDSQVGGTIDPGGGGYLTLSPPAATPAAWTVSALLLFNGANQPVAVNITTDGANSEHFWIQSASGTIPGALSFNGSSTIAVGSWRSNSFSGWHRITVTASSQTGTGIFYFDGLSQGSASITAGTTQFSNLLGDSTVQLPSTMKVADVFVWNHALDASDVLAHSKNPYSSILRPRFVRRDQTGVASRRKLGLTLQGVGP
jgi:hypothetical protein